MKISVELVDDCISKLKLGKAAGLDLLTSEHIKYSHPCVIGVITKLFNVMLVNEYVPDAFGESVTTPIPKITIGKALESLENYRGISINPVISKVFELVIIRIYINNF